MNASLEERMRALVERYGPWTAHNIHLGNGLYTVGDRGVGDDRKLRRIVQLVADHHARPAAELRLLDLACLEGLYAVEFASKGAEVVAIEGREANIARALFAQEALALNRLTLHHDDVRNLDIDTHGTFDVVLCLGILYHLAHPDVFRLLDRIAEACRPGGIVVIDTHISLRPWSARSYAGRRYWGRSFLEHSPFSGRERRLRALWASLDNTTSFWPTRSSLVNALSHRGFSSVVECHAPVEPDKGGNRITLIAHRGRAEGVLATPHANRLEPADLPERPAPSLWFGRRGRGMG